jgi:CRP/FNR family transcriptional regulator
LSKRSSKSPSNRASASPSDALTHIPLLNILSSADRQRILRDVTEEHYTKRDVIFREGDPTEYFHIVKEGTVKCVKSTAEGKECTLKMLMPGDLFCMNKQTYFDMLRRNPEAAIEVIKHLGNRLKEAQEKAKILALDRADQRLASLLVDLAMRNGVKDPQGIKLPMRLTRQDMANMVGTTTETAIRIMSRFKRERLVSGTATRLIIRDLAGLKALAST